MSENKTTLPPHHRDRKLVEKTGKPKSFDENTGQIIIEDELNRVESGLNHFNRYTTQLEAERANTEESRSR